jgi:hypothetical protein
LVSYAKLLIFARQADYPRWACGCMRQPALSLTNPNALEGTPWRECWACEQARSARRWQVVAIALLAFLVTFAACFLAGLIAGWWP